MELHIGGCRMQGGAGQLVDCCNAVFVKVLRKSVWEVLAPLPIIR